MPASSTGTAGRDGDGTPPTAPAPLAAFAAHRARRPEAAAIVADGERQDYAALDRLAGRLAELLAAHGAGPETVVAVLAGRGPRYVAMLLGVLRAGAAFLPVEAGTPGHRARQMFRAARPGILLAEPGREEWAAGLAADLAPRPTVLAAGLDQDPGDPVRTAPVGSGPTGTGPVGSGPVRPDDGLAYVLFTSGSTGVPKGAMVTDLGMANHMAAKIGDLDLTERDVVGFTAPLSFDISVWQALTPLTVGAGVAVATPRNVSEPAELVDWVRRHGVTVLEIVPSFLAVVLEQLSGAELRSALASLRYLIATGEAITPPLAARWYASCPDIPLLNAYGPTECSDDVTHHVITAAECARLPRLPIGREIPHLRVHVVDDEGRPTAPGTAGELLVGGVGVGRGYISDPVRTALAFVPDHLSGQPGARLYRTGDRGSRSADGTLDYLGRRDRQVKVRGQRIELGDVEAALLRVPEVASAACVLSGERLTAFVTLRAGQDPGTDGGRVLAAVRASAPGHLVPHRVTVLDRMPANGNGKVDHRTLLTWAARPADQEAVEEPATADDDADRADGEAAPTAARPSPLSAAAVRELVAEVLQVPSVDDDADFFGAGGDSLGAMRLVSRARGRFDAPDTSLREFLGDPTPRGLLDALRAASRAPARRPAEPMPGALSSGQERLWFLEQMHPQRGAQLIRLALTLRGRLDPRALAHALQAVVDRHEPLRTVFTQRRGLPVGHVWPTAEVTLEEVAGPDPGPDLLGASGLSAGTERPPLLAARLVRRTPREHHLVLVLHHLAADGWSLAVLEHEIETFYRRFLAGDRTVPPLATTFGTHYVSEERRWLDGPEAADCERYWADRLDGAPTDLELPLDRPHPATPDFTAHHVVHELTAEETRALVTTARSLRATPFMAVTAAFYAVLRELTGRDDVVVGVDSVNRSWPGTEDLIGTFVNQLPVRLDAPSAQPGFDELVELVRRRSLAAYERDRLPFHRIVAAANPPRRAGRFPLFQVKVTQQGAWGGGLDLPDVTVEPEPVSEPVTDLDLMLDVSGETDRLRLELVYRPAVLDRATAESWLRAVGDVLRSGTAAPKAPLGSAFGPPGRAVTADGPTDAAAGPGPTTPTEVLVADVWRDLLGVRTVDVTEDFFALGGHSLLAVRVVHELADRTGVQLELESFFELGTVREVATELDDRLASPASSASPASPAAQPTDELVEGEL